jgi:hypothetical protein
MVEEPSKVKQMFPNHQCKIGLNTIVGSCMLCLHSSLDVIRCFKMQALINIHKKQFFPLTVRPCTVIYHFQAKGRK